MERITAAFESAAFELRFRPTYFIQGARQIGRNPLNCTSSHTGAAGTLSASQ